MTARDQDWEVMQADDVRVVAWREAGAAEGPLLGFELRADEVSRSGPTVRFGTLFACAALLP